MPYDWHPQSDTAPLANFQSSAVESVHADRITIGHRTTLAQSDQVGYWVAS
jgi:hypothetical protein